MQVLKYLNIPNSGRPREDTVRSWHLHAKESCLSRDSLIFDFQALELRE